MKAILAHFYHMSPSDIRQVPLREVFDVYLRNFTEVVPAAIAGKKAKEKAARTRTHTPGVPMDWNAARAKIEAIREKMKREGVIT